MNTFISSPSFKYSKSLLRFGTLIPKENGTILKISKLDIISMWLYKIFSDSRAAPYATTSSGFIESFILISLFSEKKSLIIFFIIGILVEPPVKITSLISLGKILLSENNFVIVFTNLFNKGLHISSNFSNVIFSLISMLL